MALSRVEVTPAMDPEIMAQVVNDNFRQIEDENRTKTIVSESGEARILLGFAPNGKYGLYISKPGVDVVKELEKNG